MMDTVDIYYPAVEIDFIKEVMEETDEPDVVFYLLKRGVKPNEDLFADSIGVNEQKYKSYKQDLIKLAFLHLQGKCNFKYDRVSYKITSHHIIINWKSEPPKMKWQGNVTKVSDVSWVIEYQIWDMESYYTEY